MACRELFSCLPRSTASDTAAGAKATVSEAKPTSPGCQALRCTPATLRVCVWVFGAGRRWGRGEKSGWQLFWVTARLSNIPRVNQAFFFFFSHRVPSYWGVRAPQVSWLILQLKQKHFTLLFTELSHDLLSISLPRYSPTLPSLSAVCLRCVVGAVRRPSLLQSWWCVQGPLCSTCAASPAVFVPAACRPETAASSGRDSYCVPERTTTSVWPAQPPPTQVQAVVDSVYDPKPVQYWVSFSHHLWVVLSVSNYICPLKK